MMNEAAHTLYLIDGSGYIFRAFYALPPMNRSDGTPVNAVYGFTNMMLNLINEKHCSHMLVVFDAKRENFRNKIYSKYKANRQETPPDLVPQFSLIRHACEALNIPWCEQEGYEADDIIATYARIATEKGWHTTVISSDKDLMQLMNEHVSLYDPLKKKLLTPQDVEKKFGVSPDKVVDVQALMGDSTDNIPGATGIGPKTAAELIQQFHTLDNLLNHLDDLPANKRRENLIASKENILISKKLVELDNHVPVDINLEQYQCAPYQPAQLIKFLQENNFQSLTRKINTSLSDQAIASTPTTESAPSQNYQCLTHTADIKSWLKKAQNSNQFAIFPVMDESSKETKLTGLALAYQKGEACYIPFDGETDNTMPALDLFQHSFNQKNFPINNIIDLLIPILTNSKIIKIGFDVKELYHIFANNDPKFQPFAPFADIKLMHYNSDGMQHDSDLINLASIYLGQTLSSQKELWGDNKSTSSLDKVSVDKITNFAAIRADTILQLYPILMDKLRTSKALEVYQDIDAPLIPILYQMETNGVLVDQPHLKQLEQKFSDNLLNLTLKIYEIAGEEFNINSPAQLGVILYEKRGLSGGKRGANGHWVTDVKALENLAADGDELAKYVLQYRSFSKLKSTYVDALLDLSAKEPRIHTTYSLTNTNTGRLASANPNLQNIPIRSDEGKEIRRVFIAKSGYKLLAADYSQIELRLMAEVANVQKLKTSFLNHEDIHARTASQVLNIPLEQITPDQRRRAKAINFGIIYGISPFGLAANLGISRTEAKNYIDTYFAQYPEIANYMENTKKFVESHGFVQTPFGRTIYIPGLDNKMTKNFALRAAINAPIQGGAADIIKMAMIRISTALKSANLDAQLLLQVHDELVFEVAENQVEELSNLVKKSMENVISLSIPLVVDIGIGDNWKDAH